MRRRHPEAAARTGTLKRLARDLPAASGTLAERVASLHLADVVLEPWEDVDDPAGGEPRCSTAARSRSTSCSSILRPVLGEVTA